MRKAFKSIVLHVGPHKTGTTFIQSQLRQLQENLKASGWSFPYGEFEGVHLPANNGMLLSKVVSTDRRPPMSQSLKDADGPALFRLWLESCETPHLIISAEFMSWLTEVAQWRELRAYLEPYMTEETIVRVLIFARHPLDFAVSWRNQLGKRGSPTWNPVLVEDHVSRYERLPDVIVEALGDSTSVEWHRYEDAKASGLWSYFVQALGLPVDFPERPVVHDNSSVGYESRRILQHAPKDFVRPMMRRLSTFFNGTKEGLTAEEAQIAWSVAGERMNALMKIQGLQTYEPIEGRFNPTAPDLWPVEFVSEWQRSWCDWPSDLQQAGRVAFDALQPESAEWHPEARGRFEGLRQWMQQREPGRERELGAFDSRIQKWRTAFRIVRAAFSDAASGRRNWPSTRKALPVPRAKQVGSSWEI